MEKFRFEVNPADSVIEEATKYLVEKLNFNRTEEDLPIWRGGHDEFFFIVAFQRGSDEKRRRNKVISAENLRNRTGTEVPIGRQSFQEFYYIMAVENESDNPIGAISVAKDRDLNGLPEDDLFYIGSFFVIEKFRGIGVGKKLFNMAIECTKGSNVCLNAAGHNTEFYEKMFGFIYYSGIYLTKAQLDTKRMHPNGDIDCGGYQITDVSGAEWESIIEYDREISNREREKYLELWVNAKGAKTKVAVDVSSGKVVGFACVRPQIQNRLVAGPFYAQSGVIAKILLHKLMASVENLSSFDEVWFRFPPTNEDAIPVLDSIMDGDYKKQVTTMAQFNKKFVPHEQRRVFSIFEAAHSLV